MLRFPAQHANAVARTRETPIPGQHHRLVSPQGQVQQLDLFAPLHTARCDRPTPEWGMLPEETRQAVTDLMTRLILEHARIDRGRVRTEAADDV